jgi:hypothetical protein
METEESGPYNIYLYGMRASGKTVILNTLAKKFLDDGYTVYFFQDAKQLDVDQFAQINELLPTEQKVAIIIDEVQNCPSATAWTLLLRNTIRNDLVVVGAGVTQYANILPAANFKSRIQVNLVLKNKDDSQLKELINYWKTFIGTNSDVAVEDICRYLCSYCGGHFFATAKFTEYAFTSKQCKPYTRKLEDFIQHFCSAEIKLTSAFKAIKNRCLNLDSESASALEHVYLGTADSTEISRLERIGLYSDDKKDIVSRLLINEYLASVRSHTTAIALSPEAHPQHNLELLIVEGFKNMQDRDFQCVKNPNKFPVENSLSAAWSVRAKENVSNVYIQNQSRSDSGHVDFYCNGFINGAIEFLLDPTISSKSQNVDEHIGRFTGDEIKYKYKNWALVSFTTSKGLILPTKVTLHDKVYTYAHNENALYLGKEIIKQPAVESRSSVHKVEYVPWSDRMLKKSTKRSYSTVANLSFFSRSFSTMTRLVR